MKNSSSSEEESDTIDACIFCNELLRETSAKNIKYLIILYYFLLNAFSISYSFSFFSSAAVYGGDIVLYMSTMHNEKCSGQGEKYEDFVCDFCNIVKINFRLNL